MLESRGHGDLLAGMQEQAIIAFLRLGSPGKVAKKLGVNEKTVRNWLKVPQFVEALAEARRECFESALTQLQGLASDAVATLHKARKSSNASVAVRAAGLLLHNALRGADAIDLSERVRELEERVAAAHGLRLKGAR